MPEQDFEKLYIDGKEVQPQEKVKADSNPELKGLNVSARIQKLLKEKE